MRLLVRVGADPCVANNNGGSLLHVILKRGVRSSIWRWEAVQILLEAGGDLIHPI